MKDKLKSRKLWMAIGGLLTVAATEWLNLSPELTEQIVGAIIIIVPAYVGSQSIVDAMREYAKGKADASGPVEH
jgi:putative flippase GtrA